jgi:NAD(P)H-hydrate epimerase
VTGTPALAKGGSGDALTGILAALLAQQKQLNHSPLVLAQIGCCLHGNAAVQAEKETGQRGLLATDLLWYLGRES